MKAYEWLRYRAFVIVEVFILGSILYMLAMIGGA